MSSLADQHPLTLTRRGQGAPSPHEREYASQLVRLKLSMEHRVRIEIERLPLDCDLIEAFWLDHENGIGNWRHFFHHRPTDDPNGQCISYFKDAHRDAEHPSELLPTARTVRVVNYRNLGLLLINGAGGPVELVWRLPASGTRRTVLLPERTHIAPHVYNYHRHDYPLTDDPHLLPAGAEHGVPAPPPWPTHPRELVR